MLKEDKDFVKISKEMEQEAINLFVNVIEQGKSVG